MLSPDHILHQVTNHRPVLGVMGTNFPGRNGHSLLLTALTSQPCHIPGGERDPGPGQAQGEGAMRRDPGTLASWGRGRRREKLVAVSWATLLIAVLDAAFSFTFMSAKLEKQVGRKHLGARYLNDGCLYEGGGEEGQFKLGAMAF